MSKTKIKVEGITPAEKGTKLLVVYYDAMAEHKAGLFARKHLITAYDVIGWRHVRVAGGCEGKNFARHDAVPITVVNVMDWDEIDDEACVAVEFPSGMVCLLGALQGTCKSRNEWLNFQLDH